MSQNWGKMRKLPKTITEKELLKVVKATKSKKYKLAFMLGFYQCLRVSEVVKLLPEHVDKERGYLHLLQAKGAKDRDVPIAPPVLKGLKYLPISCSVRTLQRQLKEIAKKVLDVDIHFHTLRHSGATFCINVLKIDVRHVQFMLGHARITTTEIYTHITPEAHKKRFDEAWGDRGYA